MKPFNSAFLMWLGISATGVVASIIVGAAYGAFAAARVMAGLILGLLGALLIGAHRSGGR